MNAETSPGHLEVFIAPQATPAGPVVWTGPVLEQIQSDCETCTPTRRCRAHEDLQVRVGGLSAYWHNLVVGPEICAGHQWCDEPASCALPEPATFEWLPACGSHSPDGVVVPDEPPAYHVVAVPAAATSVVAAVTDAALAAWACCETSQGGDVADLFAMGLSTAAQILGGSEELVCHRPGSWEADHITALAGMAELLDPGPWGSHQDGAR